ncbi:hypothetical protein FRUB_03206 [Fimbriiglobus ruber]|uniref:Uncharacterized protein n=1 Tax=Fimbriiglobus ruber TaxID=1908690 RepID=A0A225E5B3_9BACT|nr:hypothetical protein FRUB_03206 [Fimbriiglobus ruber]
MAGVGTFPTPATRILIRILLSRDRTTDAVCRWKLIVRY